MSSGTSHRETELELPLEGWLRKRGEKGAIKAWKRRWFVLKGKKLFYYVTNTANAPKGFIDLLQINRIFPFTTKRKDEFAFCIVAQKEGREREYFLTATTAEERSYWVYGLTQVVRKLREEFDRLAADLSYAGASPAAVPQPSVSSQGPQAPSFYDYLSKDSVDSVSVSTSTSTTTTETSISTPTSPRILSPRLNQSHADVRSRVHENKPLPAPPPVPARPTTPGPPSTRHLKSNSDDLSRSVVNGSQLSTSPNSGSDRSFKTMHGRKNVNFENLSQRSHHSPHMPAKLKLSCPDVKALAQSYATGNTSVQPARSAKDDADLNFSSKAKNSVATKLHVKPSYLLRGEEIIWGENYVSRYLDWTEDSRVPGCLVITNYQIIFVPDLATQTTDQDGAKEEVRVPLCSLIQAHVIHASNDSEDNTNGQTAYQKLVKTFQLRPKKKSPPVVSQLQQTEQLVDLWCKDVRTIRFGFGSFTDSRKHFVDAVRTHSPASVTALFAFAYRPSREEKKLYSEHKGWGLYDVYKEYKRIGIPNDLWRLTLVNQDHTLCKSYPKVLVVPAKITDSILLAVRDFRTSGRIPVAVWRHPENGAVIVRCSQPRVGLTLQQNREDEHLLQTIRQTCVRSETLFVFDARPKANAMANQAKGAGYERQDFYKNTRFEFLGVDNIHVVRESHRKLCEQCHPFHVNEGDNQTAWYSAMSTWMNHLYTLLVGAVKVVITVHDLGSSVVVHCSDGWDRTPQIVSLAELILDSYYRTLTGFQILIEKEWLSFGHKFADRAAHYDTPRKSGKKREASPVFHQFLECVWQLSQQYPQYFEFNDQFLMLVSDHSHSGLYGTFLCNSERQREDPSIGLKMRTTSLWAHVEANRSKYLNPRYSAATEGVLPQFELCANYKKLLFWREYYFRYFPAMLPFSGTSSYG